MCVFGTYRKLGQTEIVFSVDRKPRLTGVKAFPFLLYLQITSRKRERTHRHSLREKEREKEGLTNAPQPQTQWRDRTVKFAPPSSRFTPPISLFLDLPLPFELKSTEHHHRWVQVPSTSSHSQNPTGQGRVPSWQSSDRHNPDLQPRHRLIALAWLNRFQNQGRQEARFSMVRHSQTLTWIITDLLSRQSLSRRSAWSLWSLILLLLLWWCGWWSFGGGFCVDSGRLSMGASVWLVVDFLI